MIAQAAPKKPTHLTISSRIQERLRQGTLTQKQVDGFQEFLKDVERKLLHHRIIRNNAYTKWFQKGTATDVELRHFIQQFSVFSNQFLVAALLKVINSPTLQQSRASREILLNELGVIYRHIKQIPNPIGEIHKNKSPALLKRVTNYAHNQPTKAGDLFTGKCLALTEEAKDKEGDPELVSTDGTVDGGICRFQAAHFEWLLGVAQGLGLDFAEIGKRKHGRPKTLHFCDELIHLYGSDDQQIAQGASFAVEHWAAAGFWQELEDGFMRIKQMRHPHLRLAFFTWHNRVEAQHAAHTLEELEEVYFNPNFDQAKFFEGGWQILEAITVFWDGLYSDLLQ
ncbi:hypothetical protein H6G96_31105 [Nostoc sp. FACHB-892]|uniref:hypothetical protein n=1 Tax=Nostoc sp. FACHB-892 TaxID=2692843 RepID=UPI00168909DB|nr:hypothetical protein [Nostoc sp. FACHB-892]MBD2730648.1 hypothetical protein [Nostoc sp. FACHB-892]